MNKILPDELGEMELKIGSFSEIEISEDGIVTIRYKVPIYDAELSELQAEYLVAMARHLFDSQGLDEYRILVDLTEIRGEGNISQKTSQIYNSFIRESLDIKVAITGLSTIQTAVTKFTLRLIQNSESVRLFSSQQEALSWLQK